MSPDNSSNLTVQEAQKILRTFTCLDTGLPHEVPAKALTRQSLLLLAQLSDYQMLGVCADTTAQGLSALETYATALGYKPFLDVKAVEGPVYIKFNPLTGLSYLDSYSGKHRGVLVSCQSSEPKGINEMYGHLPLDLFVSNLHVV